MTNPDVDFASRVIIGMLTSEHLSDARDEAQSFSFTMDEDESFMDLMVESILYMFKHANENEHPALIQIIDSNEPEISQRIADYIELTINT